LLWSRPLDGTGLPFALEEFPVGYLRLTSEAVSMNLSSDSVVPTYRGYRRVQAREARAGIRSERLEEFEQVSGSIGGIVIFPGYTVDGENSINQARGTSYEIGDRIDLTLECIHRYYARRQNTHASSKNPLLETLTRYVAFFDIFKTFQAYVDHFLFQDLVVDGEVNFFLPLSDFERSGLPRGSNEYEQYMVRSIAFVQKRNARMRRLVPAIGDHDGITNQAAAGPCDRERCARLS
jgi:hypothetical protein